MALTLTDHQAMLAGFAAAGFQLVSAPGAVTNPIRVDVQIAGSTRQFRLWSYDVTHGGGGSTVRAADEFRVQITRGPLTMAAMDAGGVTDLLVGFSRARQAIVAYDRLWLERWTRKRESTGDGGSPSVQVKEADIQAGHSQGIHHIVKQAEGRDGHIVTMHPSMFPAYLLNHQAVLQGTMTGTQATATLPQPVSILEYCRARGFPFQPELIARYLAALQTKPFVILAGVSGTGKSKLAELVAEYYSRVDGPIPSPAAQIGLSAGNVVSAPTVTPQYVFASGGGAADPDPDRFALVPVRPDWIDNHSILGFVNPVTERYESTQALDLILRAGQAWEAATNKASADRYFMLLDEMNLARVEHYLSDWLACTESRREIAGGTVTQQTVPLHRSSTPMMTAVRRANGSIDSMEVPASLPLPTNLVVTGTVNVDETTYGFSPKVLDRAFVIEFDEVSLDRLRASDVAVPDAGFRLPESLQPFSIPSAADYRSIPAATHEHLVALNKILEGARLHFGYRAANEIARFMVIYNGLLPVVGTPDDEWLRALDVAIVMKVLPRLNGNRARLEAPLAGLCTFLLSLTPPTADASNTNFDPNAAAILPASYGRAVEMLHSLRDFGFVSFFK